MVRILTIHKAKGLEFPIVVLVGGGLPGGGRGGDPIVDRAQRRLAVKLKAELPGAPARDLVTQAYTALAEREKVMDASEQRRLLYVAATRARDHLVVSCFGHLRNKDGSPAAVLLGPVVDALPELQAAGEGCTDGGVRVLPRDEPPGPADDDEAPGADAASLREAWRAARHELLARSCRPAPATSPSGLEHLDEDVRPGGPGAPPGRAAALALGAAAHRALQVCDLDDHASLAAAAAQAAAEAGRPDLAAETAELALACWRSAPVRAAARAAAADAGAVFREVPIGALIDGVVVQGAVDLLYRDGDAWVVVDYKTDRAADPDGLLERYGPQGAAYAVAVERATGGVVREVVFVAARAGGREVRVPVDDALRARVAGEVGAAAAEGRALRPDELSAV